MATRRNDVTTGRELNSYGRPTGNKCAHCDCAPDVRDPSGMAVDPCLGLIDGVSHACCGHGRTDYAGPYVVIGGSPGESCVGRDNYHILRGQAALDYFAEKGVGPWATSP